MKILAQILDYVQTFGLWIGSFIFGRPWSVFGVLSTNFLFQFQFQPKMTIIIIIMTITFI